MISIICFSKDRPLQLEGYIQSVLFYSGLPPSTLSILYTDTPAISYKALVQKYPLVNWVRETHFHDDLTRLVEAAHDYILLGCDDVFFTDHFDVKIPLACLANDNDLFGFSLRLGLNLHSLSEVHFDGDVLQWEWRTATKGHWDYPWEVSASIYRREFILAYLQANPSATSPNRFEGILADSCREASRGIEAKLSCFIKSKCLTLTVNRVQDEFDNEFDDSMETDIDALHLAYTAGRKLDWPSFHQTENRMIHVGSKYFRLTEDLVEPYTEPNVLPLRSIETRIKSMRLHLRLVFWRFKLALRPWIPHQAMVLLRKIRKLLNINSGIFPSRQKSD
jgi:hypothetical protein